MMIYFCLVVVFSLIPTDHKKSSLIWSAEKGTQSWWGICTKVQNMFGISIPGFGRSRFPFSKPGDFNVAWFEISEKKEVNQCWAAAAMCNDKQRIELYPATSAIEIARASPLPPTAHTMPILFGKYKLWWATCSDAHHCFHPTPPFFRYQHFGSTKPVGKRTRVYRHLPQVSACQVLLKPKGNHSRPPGADWWPAITIW